MRSSPRREKLGQPDPEMFKGVIFDGFPPDHHSVEPGVKELLAQSSALYRYSPKAIAYHQEGDEQNQPNTKLHFVVQGEMKIEGRFKDRVVHARSAHGNDPIENIFGEVEALKADPTSFLGTPNMATAWAETEAIVIEIEYEAFREAEQRSAVLLDNMQRWLVRRTFRYFMQPLREPQVTAKEALDNYVEALIRSEVINENGEFARNFSVSELMGIAGGISRQRLYEVLKTAKNNEEYEFDARTHKLKLLKPRL